MRIAYVAAPWLPVPPPAYGGSEVVIDRLARGVKQAGHEVMLFTTGDSSCPVDRRWTRPDAVPDLIGEVGVELAHVIGAYAAVRDWGADIVHDHTLSGPAYARTVTTMPVVTTNHGPFTEDLTVIYRDAAKSAAIVAISHAATAGNIPVTRIIHHGVDPTQYPMGEGQGGFYLFLGRMCADKGVREAALIALAAGVRLLIAAKMRAPSERAYFETQVKPLLTNKVQFIGEVAGPAKAELLGAAAALLNPICWPEPFGLVMIEALACGTPVLTYPLGSAPEIVDHNKTGFLCQNEAQMVARLGEVSQLDRRTCRRAAQERFSQQRMVDEHLSLYAELLTRAAHRAADVERAVIAEPHRRIMATDFGTSIPPVGRLTSPPNGVGR
ncbi:glycosyltransferase [Jatrophihabitans lederbergiae]|uniref:Glycosyltransferase n=1 Tax=Jatrophihabitans lederbergiae TaxID=3075547 RepID=A0ABU2JFD9_9ACTN|nr:glycosyltransferase [Jatrophihabitans sp. DSM 44399]MDT0263712.1 glycosyltransferase [Jatrophihabitans sp. DSM 44399]